MIVATEFSIPHPALATSTDELSRSGSDVW